MTEVILICPCCASTVDAQAAPEVQELECLTCRQTWSMVVDLDRQTEYSLT